VLVTDAICVLKATINCAFDRLKAEVPAQLTPSDLKAAFVGAPEAAGTLTGTLRGIRTDVKLVFFGEGVEGGPVELSDDGGVRAEIDAHSARLEDGTEHQQGVMHGRSATTAIESNV
jgi:hypothetical protein